MKELIPISFDKRKKIVDISALIELNVQIPRSGYLIIKTDSGFKFSTFIFTRSEKGSALKKMIPSGTEVSVTFISLKGIYKEKLNKSELIINETYVNKIKQINFTDIKKIPNFRTLKNSFNLETKLPKFNFTLSLPRCDIPKMKFPRIDLSRRSNINLNENFKNEVGNINIFKERKEKL